MAAVLQDAVDAGDALEAELVTFRDRTEHALLLPATTGQAAS